MREKMEAYLDNSATTKVFDSVREIVMKTMEIDYGNPSALHRKGVEAEKYMKDAKRKIAKMLKVEEKEIFFTSGGTESNNLAIIGTAIANKRNGNHLITTQIEHPSVTNTMKYLEEQGFQVTYLSVDKNGQVLLEELEKAICEDTILVSIMYVNNEIGALETLEEAVKIIKQKNPKTIIHSDAVQAFGKVRIYPKKIGIDLLSVSGHKIHAPKGVGFLYVDTKVKIKPISYGGEQQNGLRSGTLNIPGIAGIGKAVEEIEREFEQDVVRLYQRKQEFIDGIKRLEGIKINGLIGTESAPHIVSVSFEGVRSEVLLHALEERGIYVSAGSACSSHKSSVSPTLNGIGIEKKYLDSTLRFSFSSFTTKEEIMYCLSTLEELLPMLRRYARR